MNNSSVKAVILAAGRGTRRLPITRVIDKVMMPIVNRPVVDYVIEQAVRVGVREIVLVVSSQDTLIKKYYDDKLRLETEYPWLELEGEVTFEYLVQEASGRYGTAAALDVTRPAIGNEPFLVLMADGFIYNRAENPIDILMSGREKYGADMGLVGLRLLGERAEKVSTIELKDGNYLHALHEKPVGLEPSQLYLTNISNYLLTADIFEVIDDLPSSNGEYYLTDAVEIYAKNNKVFVAPVDGEFCDSGNPTDWYRANQLFLG